MEVCFDSLVFEWVAEFGSMLVGHYIQDMKLDDTEEEYLVIYWRVLGRHKWWNLGMLRVWSVMIWGWRWVCFPVPHRGLRTMSHHY